MDNLKKHLLLSEVRLRVSRGSVEVSSLKPPTQYRVHISLATQANRRPFSEVRSWNLACIEMPPDLKSKNKKADQMSRKFDKKRIDKRELWSVFKSHPRGCHSMAATVSNGKWIEFKNKNLISLLIWQCRFIHKLNSTPFACWLRWKVSVGNAGWPNQPVTITTCDSHKAPD